MHYSFSRGAPTMRCVVRLSLDGDGYEIAITGRDGVERIEYHATSDEVHRRWIELDGKFSNGCWKGPVTQDGRG